MTLAESDRREDSDMEVHWGSLIARIQRGDVIPILGPHLYAASTDPGAPTFDRAIAQELETQFRLTGVPRDSTLREVALRALRLNPPAAVRTRVRELINAVNHEPASLRQLAEITDFRLFVTTGYDSLLKNALDNVRAPAQTLSYSVDGERGDLPTPRTGEPTVFHLLGTTSDQLALTDAELLEHLHCWIADDHPRLLLAALRERHLLFLGCGFSDWLARFFIRIMSGKRFERSDLDPRHLVVDERVSTDPGLHLFLSHHNFSVIRNVSPADFVASLHRRWLAAPRPTPSGGTGPMRAEAREPRVFLSFCSRDREVVRTIKEALARAGIPVFFDESIEPGVEWNPEISSNLEDSLLFVPFISHSTQNQDDGYFWSEWGDAAALQRRKAPGVTFIVPVALDPIEPGTARVPERFRELQWHRLHGRAPTDTFVQFIVEKYRERQRRRLSR